MDKIIPENEMTEVEGRVYINPQTGIDTTNAFIENLRQTQQANTAQIADQTQALGTEVPSNLGGLTGGTGYWTSRYQVPQTNAAVANLRAAAQAKALNDVLANEQAVWKKRYQDTYRDYQKRQNEKSNRYYNSLTNPSGGATTGGVDEDTSDSERLYYNENELVLTEPTTTDYGSTSAMNAYNSVTGGGQIPTSSQLSGILVDKNGNRTAIRIYPGEGIEVAGGMSYNKTGARNFLSDWVKNGGQVLNYTGGGNYSTNMLAWDLY